MTINVLSYCLTNYLYIGRYLRMLLFQIVSFTPNDSCEVYFYKDKYIVPIMYFFNRRGFVSDFLNKCYEYDVYDTVTAYYKLFKVGAVK